MRSPFGTVVILLVAAAPVSAQEWKPLVQRELKALGHRNWIVVADAAYPAQTSPGIRTIVADGDPVDVVRFVLNEITKAKHVRPVIYFDAELKHLPEDLAPGIGVYRTSIQRLMGDRETQSIPHDELIAKLDKAGEKFRIIVLKTNLNLPYTTVFFELDCGYWTPESEMKLRRLMTPAKP